MNPDTRKTSGDRHPRTRSRPVYFVMELQADAFKQAAERMRHEVFVEELGWVRGGTNKRDRDAYDPVSTHLGIFRSREIIGHVRVTRRPHAFMLENELAGLLPLGFAMETGPQVAEISRLCVAAKYRSQRVEWQGRRVFLSELLYISVWHWCRAEGIVLLYFATTPPVARLLRLQGFPCRTLAEPDPVLGGVACRLDWREYDGSSLNQKMPPGSKAPFEGKGHRMAAIHRI